jgi:PAS domain S-box-containing protein
MSRNKFWLRKAATLVLDRVEPRAAPDISTGSQEQRHAKNTPSHEAKAELSPLAMMAACVKSMPGVIASFRLGVDGKGSFPYASANFENIFGFTLEEANADGEALRTHIHPDDYERVMAAIAASASQLTKYHCEYRYLHPLKGTIWIEVQSAPTRELDGAILWHGYVCDVTARSRAGEALRLSEARHRAFFDANLIGVCYGNAKSATITEANDKYLEMLGFTRDDLNAGRINWRELTAPEYQEMNEAAIAELLATGRNDRPTEKEYIRKDGSRLPVLVARALLDRDTLDGVAFILDISEQKQNEAGLWEATIAIATEKKITVALEFGASSDEALADRVQITQVLINLIRNAKEAMEPVAERRLVISSHSTESEIRIDIADTGIGLSEKRRSALFVPFATTKPSGMGVGLSISREIIEAHHGRIWGEGRPEGGAIFSFTLPLVDQGAR